MPPKQFFILLLIPTLAAVAVSPVASRGQEQPSLEKAVAIYLLQDCGSGEKRPDFWLRRVVSFGQPAVAVLQQAVLTGPGKEERTVLERDAAADYKRLRDFLAQGGLEELEEDDVRTAAQELDEATYIRMRVEGFAQAFVERAVNALVALKKEGGKKGLEKVMAEPGLTDESAELVREALEQMDKKDE